MTKLSTICGRLKATCQATAPPQSWPTTKKVLEVTLEKLVSIDFNHNSASAIIDLSLTNVVGKNMGKISAWYDNEWGFSNRMCDIAEHLHQIS